MKIDWIDSEKELPPCDGTYEVTNLPECEEYPHKCSLRGIAYYDGYGFQYLGIYRDPRFWRNLPEGIKRYGKITE